MTRILFATVGGTPEPLVTAISQHRPDHLCLVCTARDPATNRAGSESQVAGILERTGVTPEHVSVRIVPADDLETAYRLVGEELSGLATRFPEAEMTADYTGGTKSMVGALILAAVARGDVDLQVVTGSRADLVKVRDGTHLVAPIGDETLRLEWGMRPLKSAWARFAYDESAAGFASLPVPRNAELRGMLNRARDLSAAFAAWDRFDHASALQRLEMYAPALGRWLAPYLGTLKGLTSGDEFRRDAFRILDLWRNAERRAAQGRYDDAVARAYRLVEWTAQWILKTAAGVDTSDVDPARVPEGITLGRHRSGRFQAPLYTAWLLVGGMTDGPAARFFADHGQVLLNHLEARNHSILAHGFTPIGEAAWIRFSAWIADYMLPAFIAEAGPAVIKAPPPQLPDQYPATSR